MLRSLINSMLREHTFWMKVASILAVSLSSIVYFRLSYPAITVPKKKDAISSPPTSSPPIRSPPNDSELDMSGSVLLVLTSNPTEETINLCKAFHGTVFYDPALLPNLTKKTLYICGDISKAPNLAAGSQGQVFIVRELSHNYDDDKCLPKCPVIDLGRVPINVHGVGVYYRRFFDSDGDFFNKICEEHVFQSLTESNKPGTAHRTGIYLTPVEEESEGDLRFRLLRCSTNLSGPTGNFRSSDKHIVDSLNKEADIIFKNQAPLNHVLAQVYRNTPGDGRKKKATKAKIKDHSDKTKDMPENGLMAFVTFYNQIDLNELSRLDADPFDYGIRKTSALTKLNFRLKTCVLERDPATTLPHQFSLTLYPNSVFFMPLSTNRLFTHEIRPSQLDAHHIPTRMGYVVRCSNAEAIHRDGQTFLLKKNTEVDSSDVVSSLTKLEPPTEEGMSELRHLYAQENRSDEVLEYGEVLFSMNKGDYVKPLMYNMTDDFSWHTVQNCPGQNLFAELMSSVKFESVGKGRMGTVLVNPDKTRGTPIVRTTSIYSAPAHCFKPIHCHVAQQIQNIISSSSSIPFDFNNALIEKYNSSYATMGYHSDQALDLAEGTYIAVFSCYKYPEGPTASRKLVVESKEPNGGVFEVPLTDHSVVIFSVGTNKRFKHKIVLDPTAQSDKDQEWLGITFRTSKTFVQRGSEDSKDGGGVFFEDGTALTVADDLQRKDFFKMRRSENEQTDFIYPPLSYTISESDLMVPVSSTES